MKTINCYMLLLCWKAICCNSCQLTNITIAVEREECEFCITVNATWCSGYCFTRVRISSLISGTRTKYSKWCLNNPFPNSINTALLKNRLSHCQDIWVKVDTASLRQKGEGEKMLVKFRSLTGCTNCLYHVTSAAESVMVWICALCSICGCTQKK